MAHNAGGSLRAGVDDKKLEAIANYKTSPLFSAAERIALDFAAAAAAQPNAVTDEIFDNLKQHWSEGAIVEMASLVGFFGFMNRFNDSMATPLELEPIEVAEKHIAKHGWAVGKHTA